MIDRRRTKKALNVAARTLGVGLHDFCAALNKARSAEETTGQVLVVIILPDLGAKNQTALYMVRVPSERWGRLIAGPKGHVLLDHNKDTYWTEGLLDELVTHAFEDYAHFGGDVRGAR